MACWGMPLAFASEEEGEGWCPVLCAVPAAVPAERSSTPKVEEGMPDVEDTPDAKEDTPDVEDDTPSVKEGTPDVEADDSSVSVVDDDSEVEPPRCPPPAWLLLPTGLGGRGRSGSLSR